MSVLVLLHLHASELKKSILHGGRLAATSLLYTGILLDVFLRPELWVLVLAVILSLAGVVAGIALRTRAFLYSGTAFFTLNLLGQILRLYPEQRLGKAVFLMILGAAIITAMIGFNLKREAILQRIRIYRADLARWS